VNAQVGLSSLCLLAVAIVALVALACVRVSTQPPASVGSGGPSSALLSDPAWREGEVVEYRLLTKADFQSTGSNSLWGNVAHGAEICTLILPAADPDVAPALRNVMRPDCSFWNKVVGPLGKALLVGGALAGVPVLAPRKQPDWYILQHEQIHFAINEVAALQASRRMAELDPERRAKLLPRIHEVILKRTRERHTAFDGDTSGKFHPDNLEKWLSELEGQMAHLCGSGPRCRVRTPD
jgi:hypothetical protein